MPWIRLFFLAVQLALWFLNRLERQKALSEGKALAVKTLLEKSNELVELADRARSSVGELPPPDVLDEFDREPGTTNRTENKENSV